MKFRDSGLPNDKTIEDAFNYSYENAMSQPYKTEISKRISMQLDAINANNMMLLDMDKTEGKINEQQYKDEKKFIEDQHNARLKKIPTMAQTELGKLFKSQRLDPALEIQNNSEKSSPQLVAAAIMLECVRSPIDYQNIAGKFGEGISGLIAEVHHIDAYPSERETSLGKASSDAKRIYMAILVTSLNQFSDLAKNPKNKIMFPEGQEQAMFESASLLWGNDKKMDKRFVESFNSLAEVASSGFRMEIGSDGALGIIKNNFTPPRNPGANLPIIPGKKSGLGDDVF